MGDGDNSFAILYRESEIRARYAYEDANKRADELDEKCQKQEVLIIALKMRNEFLMMLEERGVSEWSKYYECLIEMRDKYPNFIAF